MMAVAAKPMNKAPGTLRANKTMVTIKPKTVNQTCGSDQLVMVTNDLALPTTMPPCFNPVKAMNNPIPTAMAAFKLAGIALITTSRTFKTVTSMKRREATKTPASAVCQGIPMPKTTE